MVEVQTAQIIRKIKILWWGSIGSILIYSSAIFLFGSLPLEDGLIMLWDNNETSIILLTLLLSVSSLMLSFTLLGKNRFQKANNIKIIMRLVVVRLVLAEVPVILGIFVFIIIHSYVLYIPFFLLSMLSLIWRKSEEKFYFEILQNLE